MRRAGYGRRRNRATRLFWNLRQTSHNVASHGIVARSVSSATDCIRATATEQSLRRCSGGYLLCPNPTTIKLPHGASLNSNRLLRFVSYYFSLMLIASRNKRQAAPSRKKEDNFFRTGHALPGILRRFLSIDIPSCLSFRPSSALRQQLRSSTMRLLARLEDERKVGAIWYINFRQSPNARSAEACRS